MAYIRNLHIKTSGKLIGVPKGKGISQSDKPSELREKKDRFTELAKKVTTEMEK